MNALTSREREIIQILASSGLSNKDVGRRLNLSEGTVKVHLHNIYQKLGVKTRTALVALAHSELLSMERSLHASLPREELPTDLCQTPSWLMSPCPYLEGETGLCNRGRDAKNDSQEGGRTLMLEQN
jgi:DNA-binding CsgD family transcriptional regulator